MSLLTFVIKKGDKLNTYGDKFEPKAEGMLHILGFNTKSIQLDEKITCQDLIDLQVNIQCYQELCRDIGQVPSYNDF